jgi:hypothetical protein
MLSPNHTEPTSLWNDDVVEQGIGRRHNLSYFHSFVRHFSINEGSPLLSNDGGRPKVLPLSDRSWWRATHAFGFCLGGTTFLLGTLLYYPAIYEASLGNDDGVAFLGISTAWLYIIGSTGFFYVDVQECFTFIDDLWLRINVCCSMVGSLLYVIGSAGFLPNIYAWSPLVGILGFWGGSLSIGCSQAWKLTRIWSTPLDLDNPLSAIHRTNAAGVEGGAMVGGYCFLIGTSLFWHGPIAGDEDCVVACGNYYVVLALWVVGSAAFTFGGYSLAKRHIIYKIT